MPLSMLIAGGGTGGHLFPGLAVAGALRAMHPELVSAIVGAGRALESRAVEQAGFTAEKLNVRALRGRGLVDRIKSLAALPGAVLAARRLLKKYTPNLVLAVGGYAAFPLGLAAWLGRVPLAVQEQNAVPGMTNRYLAKLAKLVFISFPQAESFLPAGKTALLGNPVRGELLEQASRAPRRPNPEKRFNLLVLGGSQGALSINRAMEQALPLLQKYRGHLFITHQTGPAHIERMQPIYAGQDVEHRVEAFFQDMGELYAQAHLVVCRAGAGTITELAALGRASILVPYPHAAGDHQTANARAMEEAGAALLIRDSQMDGPMLADLVEEFMADPESIDRMEAKALEQGRPQAAQEIARRCLDIMEGRA